MWTPKGPHADRFWSIISARDGDIVILQMFFLSLLLSLFSRISVSLFIDCLLANVFLSKGRLSKSVHCSNHLTVPIFFLLIHSAVERACILATMRVMRYIL